MERCMKLLGIGFLLSALTLMMVSPATFAQNDEFGSRGDAVRLDNSLPNYPVTEDFDDIAALPTTGWAQQNNSTGPGTTNWFQGNDGVISAHAGDPTAYIGANFNNTDGGADSGSGVISNWLMTPVYSFSDGDTVTFWTRTVDGSIYPDRMQVRLSTSGASTNVGTLPTDTGDFSTLLLDINPTYAADPASGGYPQAWTMYTVNISGLGAPTSGRLAFRYYVEAAGPLGANSNYIGIDSFTYTSEATAVGLSEVGTTSIAYVPVTIAAIFIVLGVASVSVRRRNQVI